MCSTDGLLNYFFVCQVCFKPVDVQAYNALRVFYSFFLLIPLFHKCLRPLLLPGFKRDRLELLTQCAEWCHSWSITFSVI